MNSMTWQQMNTLEEQTYEMKALLEVVMDGLNNDCCPSNPEDASVVLRQAAEKLIKVREIHEEMWEEQRQEKFNKEPEEDLNEDSDEEDSDFKIGGLFSEDDSDELPRFNVDLVEEHEDGSATFTVNGSEKAMKSLFDAFFTQALINGVLLTKEKNDKYCAERRALEVAQDLEVLLRTWEDSDELDYDPAVKAKREELTEALKAL